MTLKTHILLDEEYEDQKSNFKPRWPRHSFAKILILSALVLLALLLTFIYYGDFFQTEQVLHGTMHVNTAHTILERQSLHKNRPSRIQIKNQHLEELYPAEILKKWSKFKLHRYQRRIRVKRDLISDRMLDPMESDFNELRTKIRDKRTIIELSKLERDYAKCKQESLRHSDCMETFIKMYKIAKDISEKMEKMKQIFRDSELHMHASSVSSSMEKYLDLKKSSKKKEYGAYMKDSSFESTFKPKVQSEEGIEEAEFDMLNQTTEPINHGLKKLKQDDGDELIPPADVWVEKDKIPHLDENSEKTVDIVPVTTESIKHGLKKLISNDGDELIPSADIWVEKDKIPHLDENSEKTVDIVPVTSNTPVDASMENLNSETSFMSDLDISSTFSTTDVYAITPKIDEMPFSTAKIPEPNITTLQTFSETDEFEVTTETLDSFKVDPLDMIKIKKLNTTDEPTSEETDKVPVSDLDFMILNKNITATTESFHTVFVDLIEKEKVSEVTEVIIDILNQTTEAVKHGLKKLIQTDADELMPAADVWVEEDKIPHLDEKSDKSIDVLPVTLNTLLNETNIDISSFTSTTNTEFIDPTTDKTTFSTMEEMNDTNLVISEEPDDIEVTTDILDSFKVDPLDMIKIENFTSTTDDVSDDYIEPMTKGFEEINSDFITSQTTNGLSDDYVEPMTKSFKETNSDFTTSETTTLQFDKSPTETSNTNQLNPEERSSDNLRPGIQTVLSNYTTDVEFSYSGKCVSTTTGTISTTKPYDNSTADNCKTQDPSTEGPMIEKNPHERNPFEELTTTSKHPLDDPSSKENMLDDQVDNNTKILTTSTTKSIEEKWIKKFKEGSQDLSKNLTEIANTHSELIDTFGELDDVNVNKFGPKMNPSNMADGGNNKQLITLCDYLAKQTRSKVTSNPEQNDDITPSPNIQFTSRGPGFPVTGETMKASAQFFINPNFGVPSIPVCFYITPASFRMMMQPFWSPFFGMQGLGGGNAGGSGNSGGGGVFIIPPSFGNMQNSGNFFGQTSPSGSGSQGNIPNIFSKSASTQQQQKQQQFFCTYMQNGGKQSGSSGNRGFNNVNFKLRNSSGNVSSPSDIIYSSYWNKLPGYHGSNLGQEDRFQCPIEGDVPCYGGHECVPEKKWCDSTVDCSDGSDEAACTCRKRILESRICDGYQDCPLGEDEIGCFGCENFMYSCYDNEEEFQRANRSTLAMCYSSAERCDGVRNCINGRDEMGCNLLVGDLTHHMSHAVSGSSGYLYRNYHGEWYPVCNNAQRWAREACSEELGVLAEEPSVTFQEVELPGPFIESHHSGGAHFSQSCQKRERDILSDITAHVRCPQAKCGIIQELTSPLMRSRRRRRRSEAMTDASRIVGGTFSKPLQWPFIVAVYRNGDFHCGGTIFSEQWIITAAHCTINFQKYFYEVRAGMLRRSSFSSTTQIHHVTHVVVHQMYERRTMKNDLALLRIDTPLRFNRWVKPICLPDVGRTTMGTDWIWGPEVNTICTVVGWGAVREKGPGSDRLKEVQLPIRRRCTEKDDQEAEDICAGEVVGGRDACQGDSGGPLFCRSVSNNNEWYLAGVVSHGNGCARAKEFGVYTRVALYLDWIAMAMKSEFLPKVQPKQLCPGYVCIWGGKRCIPQSKRCDRLVDCLGGEDEVGCIYNYIPDVGAGRNASTTPVMDEADQDGATTTETDGGGDGKNVNGGTDTEPSSLEISNDNMAIASTDDATPNSSSALFTETISEKVKTIADSPTMSTVTVPTETPPEPITELNPSAPLFLPSSEADQSKLKKLAVKFLDTIELQTDAPTSTETLNAENTNTTPLTTASSATSISGFGDFKADLGEVSSENPTTVHKRENATEKETSTMKLKTMPKKIAQKFVCEKIPQIIDISNRCDRITDCEDGTDEDGCTCRQYLKFLRSNWKRCDRLVDCLGGEDEVGCIYNYIPDVGAGRNASTTPVMDEADQDGATTTETDGGGDGKNVNGGTDTEPSSLEISNDNMAIASTDDATPNSSSALFTETISEKVKTIADSPTMSTVTVPTETPPEPITELNPSAPLFLPSSEADQSKLKKLAVKFLDTIELQTDAPTSTETLNAENTNTTPLTTASSATSISGFGDFKADLGEVSSENPTTVHKRENATEKETSTMKLKTMPKKIAQKFVCEKIPQIIDISNRCDRITDCEDGTDEDGCTCRQYLKGPLNILICDGKIDCEDFTDEDDCGNCTATQFLCPMSKTCINSTSRCDEIVDCQFKEDEKDCFALTNGREIHLDSHKQPKLQSAGIFSRNSKGLWRVVCTHETQYHQHVAKTADEVCSLLGFKGSQFHNTTEITQDTIVPIDPDLVQMMSFPSRDRHAIGDTGHFTKHFTYHLNIAQPFSPRSERLEKSIGNNCQGLYIECVPKSNGTKPLKTLTAGNEISPKTLDVQSFKPNTKTPSISELFSDKKEEILNKLNKLIEKKKTVLVHDKLHEGVEKIHWPWLVNVYVNGELWCIGVLVDKHWVLVHESCYHGVSLDTDFITVLLGGGKSKQTLHKSPHEQIKRVDCFDFVDNSDVMLLHLDNAAHFTRHVLPTFLPDMILTEKDKGKTSNKCMSVVHDKFGGIKVTPTMEKPEATMCSKNNELFCYQWDPKAILDFKLKHFGKENEEKVSTSSSPSSPSTDQDEEVKNLLDFCKDIEDNIISYNQGVIVCREENTGWYPMAYYTFNATDCNNLKQPFAVRTLDKVYGFIQEIIDQPKCKNSDPRPRPHCPTLRCPLGNCLLPDQMCNGKVDCHDGSDEEKEYCRLHRNECKASELRCRSNGKCIPKTKFCDNISDCEDLTDEPTICSCFTYLQATDPSKICDGIRNCWDKSDESSVLCNCTSDRFPCGSSRSECIPRDFVCDKEPDCPNGEDERYCYGIEQPIKTYSSNVQPTYASGYGQVTEQSYGVWHTKCFPRHRPPDSNEVSEICRKLGYHSRRPPSYRLIDDNAEFVATTNIKNGGLTKSSPGKYRDSTKAMVINKFSPLHLNEDLTLIMKPSRPIAQLVKWNQTDSNNCYRLEVKCN